MVIRRRAEVQLPVTTADVHALLLDAAALPEWNPAIGDVRVTGPVRVGEPIPIRARGVLRGSLTYDQVARDLIRMTIDLPGLTEHGGWHLRCTGGGTVVAHEFTQDGALARLLEPATRDVAELRVVRLRERLAGRSPRGTS